MKSIRKKLNNQVKKIPYIGKALTTEISPRNVVSTTLVGATLLSGGCQSSQPKQEFKPSASGSVEARVGAYASDQRNHTLRASGIVQPFRNTSLGVLLDQTTAEPLPLDSASSYLQMRPNYDFLNTGHGKLGIVGMLESSPGFEDRGRLGLSVTPKIPGLFTQFRVYPLKTGEPGFRIDNFTAKQALDGILALELFSSYRKGYASDGENFFHGDAALKCNIGKLIGVEELEGLFTGVFGSYDYKFQTNKGNGQIQGIIGYELKFK